MRADEFFEWGQKLQLSASTLKAIENIRTRPPSRRVQGRAKNVSGVYPSQKMGLTIQFESHKVELWAIYLMEHEAEVLEFYDQPEPFKIQYQSQTGRKIGHYHTPDFFVLRTDRAGWEEWKTEKELQKLAKKYPSRYQRSETGEWKCPPGEAHAESMGLSYRVRSDAELNPTFIQNLIFLEDYFKFSTNVAAPICAQLLELVQAQPGITLAALLTSVPGVRADDVYALIAREQLYTDLDAVPLVKQWQVQLYRDQQTLEAHQYLNIKPVKIANNSELLDLDTLVVNSKLLWDGRIWTLVNLGDTIVTLLPEAGLPIQLPHRFFVDLLDSDSISLVAAEAKPSANEEVCQLMAAANPEALAKANHRFQLVQAYFQRQTELTRDIVPRTLRRWVKRFREAEAKYGCGYVGLLPRTGARGNRTPKAPLESRELLESYIVKYYETPRQAPAISVYRAYQRACEQQKIPHLSSSTFYQRLKKRRGYEQTKKRLGAKAAYPLQPWVWELARSTPRHGDRPLVIAHIDHTQLDIELRSQVTGRLLGRPWATLLMDAYSRRILAVYLTFDAPSYRSCMMTLRICVARFGRLPQTVVVDGGKEFHSVYFDTLLARYCCVKKTRPGSKPRFGSVIERLFGTTNTEFIYNLLGNTQATKQVRQLTKEIEPKRQAVWTLGDLYVFLKKWAYQVYDQSEHEALGTTPCQIYLQGLNLGGERLSRHIPYNEEFLMATRPTTRSGFAKVRAGSGIKIHYLYYWSDAFRNPQVEGTKVPVRYDPFDLGIAYAYVQGRWVKCISQYYSIFEGHSEKELLLASQEIRRGRKLTQSTPSVSAKRLAEFIANVQEHETLLLQRLKDLEGKQVQNALQVSEIETVAPDVSSQQQLVARQEATPLGFKETELKIESINLSSLPVFGEYR